MSDIQITEKDITETEKILLPSGNHFSNDAKEIIRYWKSTEVIACPGSGKTTVLLAKLRILAEKMTYENSGGICVLSHTNVAIDEIKNKMAYYSDKLIGYPNYVGTIQSFIDRFITIPYLKIIANKNIQAIDDKTYAERMLCYIYSGKYQKLRNFIEGKIRYSNAGISDKYVYVQSLYINNNGCLCSRRLDGILAGNETASTNQFKEIENILLYDEGIIRFQDAYKYAEEAINYLSSDYTDLFALRFRYVFIDEYQDCKKYQREMIKKIFNIDKTCVIKFGDSDQAIYNSLEESEEDWIPVENCLSISTSSRFGDTISEILSPLRKANEEIKTNASTNSFKPMLIVYDSSSINNVPSSFLEILNEKELFDPKGIYKAIGFIRNPKAVGIKISDYWRDFDCSPSLTSEYKYWNLVDKICQALSERKTYLVEYYVRKIIVRVFIYLNIYQSGTTKRHTLQSIKDNIEKKYKDFYNSEILKICEMNNITCENVDKSVNDLVNNLLKKNNPEIGDVFLELPQQFMEKTEKLSINPSEKNVLYDSTYGRKLYFDTIHGVKGETHDATLYLETEYKNGSDINRILQYYGIGNIKDSAIYDYCRKIAYVGMSRPRKLLCVAIKSETFEKGKEIFSNWDIKDIRNL